MQGHEANQALLGKGNGVDTLLVCLAGFKSKEPADDLEQETMENLFDTLCSVLLLPTNRYALLWLCCRLAIGAQLFCLLAFEFSKRVTASWSMQSTSGDLLYYI